MSVDISKYLRYEQVLRFYESDLRYACETFDEWSAFARWFESREASYEVTFPGEQSIWALGDELDLEGEIIDEPFKKWDVFKELVNYCLPLQQYVEIYPSDQAVPDPGNSAVAGGRTTSVDISKYLRYDQVLRFYESDLRYACETFDEWPAFARWFESREASYGDTFPGEQSIWALGGELDLEDEIFDEPFKKWDVFKELVNYCLPLQQYVEIYPSDQAVPGAGNSAGTGGQTTDYTYVQLPPLPQIDADSGNTTATDGEPSRVIHPPAEVTIEITAPSGTSTIKTLHRDDLYAICLAHAGSSVVDALKLRLSDGQTSAGKLTESVSVTSARDGNPPFVQIFAPSDIDAHNRTLWDSVSGGGDPLMYTQFEDFIVFWPPGRGSDDVRLVYGLLSYFFRQGYLVKVGNGWRNKRVDVQFIGNKQTTMTMREYIKTVLRSSRTVRSV